MPSTDSSGPATVEDVVQIMGRQDDLLIAQILRTGATKKEVLEAYTWLYADDHMGGVGRPQTGRVGAVLDILEADQAGPGEP